MKFIIIICLTNFCRSWEAGAFASVCHPKSPNCHAEPPHCHAEFISASLYEIPKRVRDDDSEMSFLILDPSTLWVSG